MQKKNVDADEDWIYEARRIKIHDAAAFAAMRPPGAWGETLDFITPHVVPGVTTEELDRLCHDFIVEREPFRRR